MCCSSESLNPVGQVNHGRKYSATELQKIIAGILTFDQEKA
jgi:hypothetical protein